MLKTIWIMWKPGEERVYTMAVQPSEPWATTQKDNGYFIASFDVELPDPTISPIFVGSLKVVYAPSLGNQVHIHGDFALMDDGSIWSNTEKVAQVSEIEEPPSYLDEARLTVGDRAHVEFLARYWLGWRKTVMAGVPPVSVGDVVSAKLE